MSRVTVKSREPFDTVVPFSRLKHGAFFVWRGTDMPRDEVRCKVGERDYVPIEAIQCRHTVGAEGLTRPCIEVDIDVTWTPTAKEDD